MEKKNEKLDMKKTLKTFYTAKRKVQLIDVPPVKYISFQGRGNPNTSQEYQDAMGVLFGMAYTIKFDCKKRGNDFVVMPLEGQWWSDVPKDFAALAKDDWNWNAMIAVPDFVETDTFEAARAKLKEKKNPAGLERAKLETLTDGLSAQFLYFGPYADEAPHIAEMHKQIEQWGYCLTGRHREIYFNSPKRVSSLDKLKTIIRQPVKKA
ncbi:MAG: GyrI-like domain-containing protein [Spirochaetales bacterium]|nr:GyrI-like domain-containing protein [Spirochaetales bacterium]